MYRNSKEDLKICNEMANNTRNNFQSSKIPLSLEMAIYWIKFVQEFRLIDILQDNKELEQRIKKLEDRLQISPYGDDKIDELEECIGYKDCEIEQLKQQIKIMKCCGNCGRGGNIGGISVCNWMEKQYECWIPKKGS